jgi:hypothetical protein
MMKRYAKQIACGLLGVALLAGCGTTRLTSVWKDPLYQVRPAKVLVVAISDKAVSRRIMEDEFVAQMQRRGTEAIASYTLLGDQQQDDRAAIADKVKELGADSVLMARLVDKQTVRIYVPDMPYYPPTYYNTWPEYYGYRSLHTPGYIAEEQFSVLETNLYETSKDRLIWSALSDDEFRGSSQRELRGYVNVMVRNMAHYGLLNKKPRE